MLEEWKKILQTERHCLSLLINFSNQVNEGYSFVSNLKQMKKRLSQNVKDQIDKCQSAALAAVESYNRPGRRFRTAQYIVLITIAWTALFHAIFLNQKIRPYYRKKTSGDGTGVRYVKVDGEPKYWDLGECLRQYHKDDNSPERKNLEFLIELRNKIEHRYLPELDASLYGECQAALLNLEEAIVKEFGTKYVLTDSLAISLQFSREIPIEKKRSSRKLATNSARTVQEYIERFRGNLPSTVLSSMKYSFNVFLIPKVVNRESAADASVQFIPVNEASEEELKKIANLNVLIKEKHIPVANLELYKPSQVIENLEGRLPFRINMATHTSAWKHYKVRPPSGARNPEKTNSKYCIFDKPHSDYLYTRAWIEQLASVLSTEKGYLSVVGRRPKNKPS